MDRWYGPKDLNPDNPQNAVSVLEGAPCMQPLSEIAPKDEEMSDRWHCHGKHTDTFWNSDANGSAYLDQKLTRLGVDTIAAAMLYPVASPAFADTPWSFDHQTDTTESRSMNQRAVDFLVDMLTGA